MLFKEITDHHQCVAAKGNWAKTVSDKDQLDVYAKAAYTMGTKGNILNDRMGLV